MNVKDYNSYFYGYDKNGHHEKGYIDYIEELYSKFPINEEITH